MKGKRREQCQSFGCSRRAPVDELGHIVGAHCGLHDPATVERRTEGLRAARAAGVRSPGVGKRKRRERRQIGICLHRSARLLARFPNLSEEERKEVVPPCGKAAYALNGEGDEACPEHVRVGARVRESVTELDGKFVSMASLEGGGEKRYPANPPPGAVRPVDDEDLLPGKEEIDPEIVAAESLSRPQWRRLLTREAWERMPVRLQGVVLAKFSWGMGRLPGSFEEMLRPVVGRGQC